jgi:hypothetical protein
MPPFSKSAKVADDITQLLSRTPIKRKTAKPSEPSQQMLALTGKDASIAFEKLGFQKCPKEAWSQQTDKENNPVYTLIVDADAVPFIMQDVKLLSDLKFEINVGGKKSSSTKCRLVQFDVVYSGKQTSFKAELPFDGPVEQLYDKFEADQAMNCDCWLSTHLANAGVIPGKMGCGTKIKVHNFRIIVEDNE